MAIITLTTDFGTTDYYAAAIKGVILTLAPKATIVDVTHQIAPAGVTEAGFTVAQLPVTFPPDSIHLAVVDPTVGTPRPILAARAAGQTFIAPDNGLLTFVQQRWGIEEVHQVRPAPPIGRAISDTFHGRDIMAPAAAALADGAALAQLGPLTQQMEILNMPQPTAGDGQAVGQVLHVDRFGNCTTNISSQLLRSMLANATRLKVSAGQRQIGSLARTYADVPARSPVALVGSADLLEIAVNLGSAAQSLGLAVGSEVTVRAE